MLKGDYMPEDKKLFQWRTETGNPTSFKSEQGTFFRITPQAQALVIRWPNGGLIWNRPTAVLVSQDEKPNSAPTRVPIIDVTRIAQGILLGLSIIFTVISIIVPIKSRREQNE